MAAEQATLPGWATMAPGPGLAAHLTTLDPDAIPDKQLVPLLQARWRQVNHDNAQYLAAITHLQQRLEDPWTTVAEVAAGLRYTDRRADTECLLAHQLAHRLPQVWAALNDGTIDLPKARIYAQYLGDDTDPDSGPTDTQIAAICTRLLPKTPRWTTGQLAARLLRELLAIDPTFTRRRYQRAARDRGVWGYLSENGTAVLSGHGLTPTEAAAAAQRLEQLAKQARAAGHPHTEQQLRADLFIRLLDGRCTGQTQEQIITALLAEAATTDAAATSDAAAAGDTAAGDTDPSADADPTADADAGPTADHTADQISEAGGTGDAATGDAADGAHGADATGAGFAARGTTNDVDTATHGRIHPAASTTDRADHGTDHHADHDPEHDPDQDADLGADLGAGHGAVAGSAAAAASNDSAMPYSSAAAAAPSPEHAANQPAAAEAANESAAAAAAAEPTVERGGGSTTDPPPAATPDPDPDPAPAPSPDPAEVPPQTPVGERVGIEIRLGLNTLLGLDEHPGELPGWGPVLADIARQLVQRQHAAEWRFAILDDTGYLLYGGITRHRPPTTHPTHAGRVRGGIVELHIRASQLTKLARRPDLPPGWTPLITDLTSQYATHHHDRHHLDASPDTRLPRAGLRRHIQMRDRTCVAPGCRRPAIKTDQDHTLAYQHGGLTVSGNLGPLCARHHRMKHDCGWNLQQPRPGFFHWRSPLGQHYYTRGEPIAPDLPEPIPRPGTPPDDHKEDQDGPERPIRPIRPIFTPLMRNGHPPPQPKPEPEPAPAEEEDDTPPPF